MDLQTFEMFLENKSANNQLTEFFEDVLRMGKAYTQSNPDFIASFNDVRNRLTQSAVSGQKFNVNDVSRMADYFQRYKVSPPAGLDATSQQIVNLASSAVGQLPGGEVAKKVASSALSKAEKDLRDVAGRGGRYSGTAKKIIDGITNSKFKWMGFRPYMKWSTILGGTGALAGTLEYFMEYGPFDYAYDKFYELTGKETEKQIKKIEKQIDEDGEDKKDLQIIFDALKPLINKMQMMPFNKNINYTKILDTIPPQQIEESDIVVALKYEYEQIRARRSYAPKTYNPEYDLIREKSNIPKSQYVVY